MVNKTTIKINGTDEKILDLNNRIISLESALKNDEEGFFRGFCDANKNVLNLKINQWLILTVLIFIIISSIIIWQYYTPHKICHDESFIDTCEKIPVDYYNIYNCRNYTIMFDFDLTSNMKLNCGSNSNLCLVTTIKKVCEIK